MRAELKEDGVLTCQIDGTKARLGVFESETALRWDRSSKCLRAMCLHAGAT
jgi:hypothetical protein